jgi:hypothetical protein
MEVFVEGAGENCTFLLIYFFNWFCVCICVYLLEGGEGMMGALAWKQESMAGHGQAVQLKSCKKFRKSYPKIRGRRGPKGSFAGHHR